MTSLDAQAFNEEGRPQWEQKAALGDALHGNGRSTLWQIPPLLVGRLR